jgi:hypothetical protein
MESALDMMGAGMSRIDLEDPRRFVSGLLGQTNLRSSPLLLREHPRGDREPIAGRAVNRSTSTLARSDDLAFLESAKPKAP